MLGTLAGGASVPDDAGVSTRGQAQTRARVAEQSAVTDPGRTVEELFLYAFATQAEVLRHVRTQGIPEERGKLSEILDAWQGLQSRVKALTEGEAGLPETLKAAPLPARHQTYVASVAGHPLFRKTFQHLPVSFEMVAIDQLVAPQRTVNLTHVQRIRTGLPSAPSAEELLHVCLWPERDVEPVRHLEIRPNVHVFSSPMTDLRFLDSGVRDVRLEDLDVAESGGLPLRAVLAFVGYGCSSINVFRAGQRCILNNGFHRVYALRSLGVAEIPVVVQHLHNLPLESPDDIAGLPSGYLLHAPRPVLMKDFFVPGFTLKLRVRERIRVVKVTVSASKHDALV